MATGSEYPKIDNPVIDLKFRARDWQAEVFRSLKRFTVLLIHRRAGKTVLAIMKLIDAALRFQGERGRFAYIAPELKQAKAVAWDYLKSYAGRVPDIKINEAELWIEFPNNSARIRIYGADNPNSMRGLYFDGVVVDEVAQAKPQLWDEVLLPALADRLGWAIFIGTAQGIDLLSKLYYGALNNPEWHSALLTVYQTNTLSSDEIEKLKEKMSPKAFRREMMCDLSASRDDTLLTIDEVLASMKRDCKEADFMFSQKRLGVDVARQGDDKTVIFKRQGLVAFSPGILTDARATEVAGAVLNVKQNWGADLVLVDGTGGYGAGVIDCLIAQKQAPIEVQFGGRPDDPRYKNKRAEMWFRMAEWVKRGGCLPDSQELLAELTSVTYWHDVAGKMQLEDKADLKSRLGISPDRADALACTFAIPEGLSPKGKGFSTTRFDEAGRAVESRPSWEYNPLEKD